MAHAFVDTGANYNTKRFFDDFIARRLVAEFSLKGPESGVRINLVGGQNLMISCDRVKMEVDVATNMGSKHHDFLILENDAESLVMGVQWHYFVGRGLMWRFSQNCEYRHIWIKLSNPLEPTEDKAEVDSLLDDDTIEFYPESKELKGWSLTISDFPDQKSLRSIGETWPGSFSTIQSQECLRVDSLHLEIDPNVTFRMQPCRFIRSDILRSLKAMIDEFVSEGVLIPDISCSHASPLVIVRNGVLEWQWIIGRLINSYGYLLTNYRIKICFFSS